MQSPDDQDVLPLVQRRDEHEKKEFLSVRLLYQHFTFFKSFR